MRRGRGGIQSYGNIEEKILRSIDSVQLVCE